MRKILVVLVLLLFITFVQAEEFITQDDSYFGPSRTKIIWSISSGISSGSAHGYRDLNNGMNVGLELFRLVGNIRPESRFFRYVWLTILTDYNLYENDRNIYELLINQFYGGVGFNLENKGFFKNIIPYFGGGMGFGFHWNKFDINFNEPFTESGNWTFYMAVAGMEYNVSDRISFFMEANYLWGSLNSIDKDEGSNYIPDEYDRDDKHNGNDDYAEVPGNMSFSREEIEMRQLTIKAGVRFYWGLDMFWFFPFFWEE